MPERYTHKHKKLIAINKNIWLLPKYNCYSGQTQDSVSDKYNGAKTISERMELSNHQR